MSRAIPATLPERRSRTAGAARWRWRISGWHLAAGAVSLVTLVPLAVVLASFLTPQPEVWQHLADNVLVGLLANTFWLVAGVAAGSAVIGISLAWLTAVCEFPGRRFFAWALMLPLAMPAYVTAFAAIGLLDYTGPLQGALRGWFGSSDWMPEIRSRGGVIAVMTLALYPYVYLLARNAFLTQGRRALEAGQSLGLSRRQAFFRLALPMARPWLAAGVMLAVMETLADFGTVAVFNYDTFTTAIYKAWFGLFSLPAAAQLASILVLLVLALVGIEQRWQRGRRYFAVGRSQPARIALG
ncbi:MAG: ABC transporter permease subunit, partial [Burkholderiaceae bacterium]